MTEPTTVNLTVYRGDTFSDTITVTEADGSASDLSTVSEVKLQARPHANSGDTYLSLTLTGGDISISTNVITITITAAVSAALTFNSAPYDLELTFDNGSVLTVAVGTIEVTRDISQ